MKIKLECEIETDEGISVDVMEHRVLSALSHEDGFYVGQVLITEVK
jgi:hypothetical protein